MGANFRQDERYFANVTMRSRMSLLQEMKSKLEGTPRDALFRATCFGNWLDIPYVKGNGHLMHLILQTQIECSQSHDPEVDSLIYTINDVRLKFGPKEFCLISGLRFGPIDSVRDKVKKLPFRDRVFGDLTTKSIHLMDLKNLYEGPRFKTLSDLDAVRVCLLMILELVFCGSGGDMQNVVDPFIVSMVENLDEWNRFPWGSHVWVITHASLKDAVPRRRTMHLRMIRQDPGRVPKYTLMGFIWAFKIWILESCPISRQWWSLDDQAIPRGIAWNKSETFSTSHHIYFYGDLSPDLMPRDMRCVTAAEARTDWWIASSRYFDGEHVPPPHPSPHRTHPVERHIHKEAPDSTAAMPPPPQSKATLISATSAYTQVSSLEERLFMLERDHLELKSSHLELKSSHSELKRSHVELQRGFLHLHRRYLVLEQKVLSSEKNPNPIPDPDVATKPETRLDEKRCDMSEADKRGMSPAQTKLTSCTDLAIMAYDTGRLELPDPSLPQKRMKRVKKYIKSPFCELPDITPVARPEKKSV